MNELLTLTEAGLYCPAGDFYLDPWRRVERAVVTHAHSDHARWGMGRYLCAEPGLAALRTRIPEGRIDALPYGEVTTFNGVRLSLHPAGHVLGSAQVRIEGGGYVAVVSGDYKRQEDPTCEPFEPVKCHRFVTESTFGLPIYHWPAPDAVYAEINHWWQANQSAGKCSLLMGYTLGKAQRLLAGLNPELGPIVVHGAIAKMLPAYAWAGVELPKTKTVNQLERGFDFSKAIVLAPPSVLGTPWTRRFGDHSTAFASGWMQIRGVRRRRSVDRGFVLSDHVDWNDLMQSIRETGAEEVWVTHGYSAIVVRHLIEQGLDARVLATQFEGEPNVVPEEEATE